MPVPRFTRPSAVFVVAALLCLMAVAPMTGALAQTPDPAPLWKAYPLTPDQSAGAKSTGAKSTGAKPTERPSGDPLNVDAPPLAGTTASGDVSNTTSVPLAVAVAFYVALAGLSALAVGAATLWFVRRRSRPVVCEITWSPDEQGDAFLATAQREGDDDEWVVARSGRFDRRTAEPPEYDAASHAAYDKLLNDLYADGWLPYERGREWWAMRLRRTGAPESRTPTQGRPGASEATTATRRRSGVSETTTPTRDG